MPTRNEYRAYDASAGVPTSVLSGAFELGGSGPMQARANRAAWTETLAFLGEQ
jgi:hypothetical protein